MSGDRPKKPTGWHSKEQRAARPAAFAERKSAAAAKRARVEAERAARDARLEPMRRAGRIRQELHVPSAKLDPELVAKARANSRKARVRDIIDVRPGKKPEKVETTVPPTPEQARHADYIEDGVYEVLPGGRRTLRGRAFQRLPRFESIEGLSVDQLRALRHYRRVFDASEQSEVKSALDIRPRGGGGADGAILRLMDIVEGRAALYAIEQVIPGALRDTMRAVALLDIDFKQLAIDRFGSREVQRIDTSRRKPMLMTTIEPRSGRHRALIRDEFMAGATALAKAITPALREQARTEAAAITVRHATPSPSLAPINPAFLDEHGRLREMEEIAAIILQRSNLEGEVDVA